MTHDPAPGMPRRRRLRALRERADGPRIALELGDLQSHALDRTGEPRSA